MTQIRKLTNIVLAVLSEKLNPTSPVLIDGLPT